MPTFKQYHKNNVLIGTGAYKFRPYTVLSATVSLTTNLTGCTMSPAVTAINQLGQSTLTFVASTNYRLPTSVQVTGATAVSWDQNTGKLVIEKPTADTVSVKVVATKITYSITTNLTNVTKSSGPASIEAGGTATLVFAAADNYELPDTVTVTNASHTWDKSTGKLTITNVTGAVAITVTATQQQLATPTNVSATGTVLSWDAVENAESYDIYAGDTLIGNTDGDGYIITTTITNGTYSGDSRVLPGGTATVTITANDGYALPDSVTVTGASGTWNKSTGTLSISNPTGNVTVTGECVAVQTGYEITGGASTNWFGQNEIKVSKNGGEWESLYNFINALKVKIENVVTIQFDINRTEGTGYGIFVKSETIGLFLSVDDGTPHKTSEIYTLSKNVNDFLAGGGALQ